MSVAPPLAQIHEAGQVTTMDGQRAGNGRLRAAHLPDGERHYALAVHLSLFATLLVLPPVGCMAPIILWLVRREKSAFINDHGRELCNVVITGAILTLALAFLPIVGWMALLIWYIVTAINVVRGAVASNRGEYFRYPMTFRLL